MSDVLFDKRPSGVALITLNRPDSLNAMGGELMPLLAQHLRECASDPEVRCVVLTGAGRAFCAGGDVKAMAAQRDILPGANGGAKLPRTRHQLLHLRGNSNTDSVGEADLVGRKCHQALDDSKHLLRGHGSFERTAESDADGHRDGHAIGARPPYEAQRCLDALVTGRVLVAPPERVGRCHGVMHLIDSRGKRPLVTLLV